MSLKQAVTEAILHTPHGDLPSTTPHVPHCISTTHITHPTISTLNEPYIHTTPMSTQPANPMTDACSMTAPTPNPEPNPEPTILYEYATMPLPELAPADLRLLSHNINTLQTTTSAELGATFDAYEALNPTIIGLQETNKNWTIYDKTEGPL